MKILQTLGLSIAAAAIVAAPVAAQDEAAEGQTSGLESTETLSLAELRCWDVVTLGEDDRAFALVLLYGYASGAKGEATMSPRAVQVAVINTMQECLDKPDAKALDILKTHMHSS